jgi:hypothetical protein
MIKRIAESTSTRAVTDRMPVSVTVNIWHRRLAWLGLATLLPIGAVVSWLGTIAKWVAARARAPRTTRLAIAIVPPTAAIALAYLSFRQMSLAVAIAALAVNLYGLLLGRRSNRGAFNQHGGHQGLVAFRLVIGVLVTGSCLVMLGFLALASLGSLPETDGPFASDWSGIDDAIAHHGYRPPRQPRPLESELPALAVLNPALIRQGIVTPWTGGVTIVAEGSGYCLSAPESDAGFDHYHSSSRRTDIIPCH